MANGAFTSQTIDSVLAVLRAQEQAMGRAPDLRSAARRECDTLWAGLTNKCVEKFGRAPSLDGWSQHDDGCAVLLGRTQDAEATFINMPAENTRAEFHAALLAWVNYAVKGWPDAKTYQRQERERQRDRLGPWRTFE